MTLDGFVVAKGLGGDEPFVHQGDAPMRAAVFNGPHAIELAVRPDPKIQAPTDAIVRSGAAGIATAAI